MTVNIATTTAGTTATVYVAATAPTGRHARLDRCPYVAEGPKLEVPWRGRIVAECGRLLSAYRFFRSIEGSNPSLSAKLLRWQETL